MPLYVLPIKADLLGTIAGAKTAGALQDQFVVDYRPIGVTLSASAEADYAPLVVNDIREQKQVRPLPAAPLRRARTWASIRRLYMVAITAQVELFVANLQAGTTYNVSVVARRQNRTSAAWLRQITTSNTGFRPLLLRSSEMQSKTKNPIETKTLERNI